MDERLVEAAPRAGPVDVLERGLAAQVGVLPAPAQLALRAVNPFGVDERADAIAQ
jgi:hypothetical protein